MIILIGSQKGGAGKSTLTLLLANYLTSYQGLKVTVLDMDYQQSISSKFEKSKILDSAPPFEVIAVDLIKFPQVMQILGQNNDEIILIDLPGKMDDDLLIPVIIAGHAMICPFNYDQFTVESTILFAMVCKQINSDMPMIFLPNRIKLTVKYETKMEVDRILGKFGKVLSGIPDRIDFQRLETFHIPPSLIPLILTVLESIQEFLKLKIE